MGTVLTDTFLPHGVNENRPRCQYQLFKAQASDEGKLSKEEDAPLDDIRRPGVGADIKRGGFSDEIENSQKYTR